MSPRDRRKWRVLQNDRRALIEYKAELEKLLQSASDSLDLILDEIDNTEESLRQDEAALARLALKYDLA